MADIVVRTNRKNEKLMKAQDLLALELAWGMTPEEALDVLSKGDPVKRTRWRRRLQRWSMEAEFQDLVAMYLKGLEVVRLGSELKALHRRAIKGNVPAIKLALESSGYHNPRVQHDHSGDIQVTIRNAPRPERVSDEAVEDIVDATVVDG